MGGHRLVGAPICHEVRLDEDSGPWSHLALDPGQQIQALLAGSVHAVLSVVGAFDEGGSVHFHQ